ncbi:hypothetical protein [Kocuria atrinae]|uniref:hypothetical protein n=1 Tax=Kocuria atrinae TaxID=592377 RepID=UPI001CB88C01|nr:hypothetical protein [Kocuria atrinae]
MERLFLVAALGILTVLWDMNARRIAGVKHWFWGAVVKDGLPAFVAMIGTGLVVYVISWTGWLTTANGYHRQWAEQNPGEGLQWLPPAFRSLWEYHVAAYSFHAGLDSEHTYMAGPALWPILARPTSYFYESPERGVDGCTVNSCSQAILNQGNPAIWWVGIAAVLFALMLWAVKRDWRFGGLLGMYAAAYIPWFLYPDRTMFYFYALAYFPFMVLIIVGALGVLTGRVGIAPFGDTAGTLTARNRFISAVWGHRWTTVALAFMSLVVVCAVFFWPVWTAQTIPYDHWRWRMWFDSWI